jgi:glycosyltransferase involved in cell wall biosynthesis
VEKDIESRTRFGIAEKGGPGDGGEWGRGEPQPRRFGRLLVFNLATDSDHPVLGFGTLWLRELARLASRVEVITMYSGRLDLPENVRVWSAGREQGWGRPRRAVRFLRLLVKVLSEEPVEGCFSHMNIQFSALAGPLLQGLGIPMVTWYAHPSITPTLRLAHWVSDRILTSFPRAFPLRSEKVRVIGQGIDPELFSPDNRRKELPNQILCVGRVSPVKDLRTLVRAVARLKPTVELLILGATSGPEDESYRQQISNEADALGVGARVRFGKPVTPEELPNHFRSCAVHVNLTPAGFGDKVALEAMSCGRPCVVANSDFASLLGAHGEDLLFAPGDVLGLAEKLERVLGWSSEKRAEVGSELRDAVVRGHSLERLTQQVIEELSKCKSQTRK